MVIAVLVNRFAPSSRGLRRAETPEYLYDSIGDGGVIISSNSGGGRRYYEQQRQNRFYRSNRRIMGMSTRKVIQSSSLSTSTSHWAKLRNITHATSAFTRLYPKVVLQDDINENDDIINAKDGIMKTTTYDDRYYALTNNNNSSRQQQSQSQFQQPHAPSSSSSSTNGRQQQQKQSSFSSYYSSIRNMGNVSEATAQPPTVPIGNTKHRRKPFKAISFVTSFASDMDVIADWIFYRCAINADQNYRTQWIEQYGDNNIDSTSDPSIPLPYMVPPLILQLALISCILGTIMWLVLATDGRVAVPLCRLWGIDRLSMGMVLFVCVLVEDIPQIILTFVIEEYYEEGRSLSTFAVTNVIISVYDILIKLAEAYDDRHDVVETGVWCKVSIPNAHNDTITALALLAPHHITNDSNACIEVDNTSPKADSLHNKHIIQPNNRVSGTPTSSEPVVSTSNQNTSNSPALTTDYTNMSSIEEEQQQNLPTTNAAIPTSNPATAPSSSKRSLDSCSQQAKIQSQTLMRFLTVSKDKKIRLWESDYATIQRSTTNLLSCSNDTTTPNNNNEYNRSMNCNPYDCNSSTFNRRNKCLKVFKGHQYAITCITILGTIVHDDIHQPPHLPEQDEQSQSTTGSTLDYNHIPSPKPTTASPTHHTIPKFGIGQPSKQQQQHCTYFLTGCQNGTIKLWNMNGTSSGSIREYLCLEGNIKNPSSAVTSLVTFMEGITFLAGYATGPVRLWDAWTGTCIALYHGHHGSSNTRTICCTLQDDTLFISGSSDSCIHLWDTTSAMNAYHLRLQQQQHNEQDEESVHNIEEGAVGSSVFPRRIGRPQSPNLLHQKQQQQQQQPLRKFLFSENKFQGHTDGITSLCCMEPGLAFLSGSRDGTVRLWSVQTGMCLRVFSNSVSTSTSTSGITVVRAIDHVTFLTGSDDATIRLWDALTGNIIRIYTGHTKPITDLTVTDDDSTFITTSVDRSIKVWVVSAVNNGSSNSMLEPNNQYRHPTSRYENEEERDDPMFVILCHGANDPY